MLKIGLKKCLSLILVLSLIFVSVGVQTVYAGLGELDTDQQLGQSNVLPIGISQATFGLRAVSLNFDISVGSIIVEKGTNANTLKITQGGVVVNDNVAITTMINITGTTTTNSVVVNGTGLSGATILMSLTDANIDVSSAVGNTAFDLSNNAVVDLTLVGTSKINSGRDRAGIKVEDSDGGKLTIRGNGSLESVSSNDSSSGSSINYGTGFGAGIGGNSGTNGSNSGEITIVSGTVNAYSGKGAGIGGGGGSGNNSIGGNSGLINILGGTIYAKSVDGAAIGGGYGGNLGGTGSGITIEDGRVIAVGFVGAAIGGGSGTNFGGTMGGLTVKGGTIDASSVMGAGIGGGFGGTGGTAGGISVTGGTVTAVSNRGSAIGGGGGNTLGGDMGGLSVGGGTVIATADAGAGIGGGAANNGQGGRCDNIYITRGSVNATSKTSSGIGGGFGTTMGLGGTGVLEAGYMTRNMLHTPTDTNFRDLGGISIYQVDFIIQDEAGNLLEGVEVAIKGDIKTTISGQDGKAYFNLKKPSPPMGVAGGDYTMDFSLTGYEPQSSEVIDISTNPEAIIVMKKVSAGMPTVTADLESVTTWTTDDININLNYIPGSNGTIKWTSQRYILTQNTTPSGTYGIYNGTISIKTDGEWYVYYAVRDENYNGGEWITGVFGPYRHGTGVVLSSSKNITNFSIDGYRGVISRDFIIVSQLYGTNLTNLTPSITHTGKLISPGSGVAQDFSVPVTYTVQAEDGSTKTYKVLVLTPASPDKEIKTFSINGVKGTIVGTRIILTLPYGTDLTNLTPVITHTGQSISPGSKVPNDFSSTATYTVTAANGTTQQYEVDVFLTEPLEDIPPFVTPVTPIQLDISGINSNMITVDLGYDATGIDNLADYVTLTIEDTSIATVVPKQLYDDSKVYISGKAKGTTKLIVKFYKNNAEMTQITVIIPITVIESIIPGTGGIIIGEGNGNSGGSNVSDNSLYFENNKGKNLWTGLTSSLNNCDTRPFTLAIGTNIFEKLNKEKIAGQTLIEIKAYNYTSVSIDVLKSMQKLAEKNGVKVIIHFDRLENRKVVDRITVNPELATKSIVLCIDETRAAQIEVLFEKWFKNDLATFSTKEKGSFGKTVNISIIPSKNQDTNKLVVYNYNAEKNTYTKLENPNLRVDNNGYLHFDTNTGGDFLISEGDLVKK